MGFFRQTPVHRREEYYRKGELKVLVWVKPGGHQTQYGLCRYHPVSDIEKYADAASQCLRRSVRHKSMPPPLYLRAGTNRFPPSCTYPHRTMLERLLTARPQLQSQIPAHWPQTKNNHQNQNESSNLVAWFVGQTQETKQNSP